jgi:hypothetical protein
MSGPGNKRGYIQRKKYLKDCAAHINSVLEFIRLVCRDPGGPEHSQRQALAHAQSIEAFCWSPHSHLSAENYQKIMAAKTQELCHTILIKSLPSFDFPQLCRLAAIISDSSRVRRPVLPMPIIPHLPAPEVAREEDLPAPFEGLNIESPALELESQPSPFLGLDEGLLARFDHELDGLELPF